MGCPTIHGPPDAAVDTAVFALVLCFGLLVAAQLLLLWLTLRI